MREKIWMKESSLEYFDCKTKFFQTCQQNMSFDRNLIWSTSFVRSVLWLVNLLSYLLELVNLYSDLVIWNVLFELADRLRTFNSNFMSLNFVWTLF